MTGHAAPFYCPYCGDERLRPDGESHGQWRCESCLRVFDVKYRGMTGRSTRTDDTDGEVNE